MRALICYAQISKKKREESNILYFYIRLRSIYSPTVPLPIPPKKYMRALICYAYISKIKKRKERNILYFYTRLRSIYSPTVPLPIILKKFMRALICYAYIWKTRIKKRKKNIKNLALASAQSIHQPSHYRYLRKNICEHYAMHIF